MSPDDAPPVGYVLKRYPRYSETFVVREILAHEAAGVPVEIFVLRLPEEEHVQDLVARVRARVTYLPREAPRKAADMWTALEAAGDALPGLWAGLEAARGLDLRTLFQALDLARAVRERAIPHLHAHFANEACDVARLAAGFAGIEYSVTAHAKDIFHDEVGAEELRRKLQDARSVVTVSEYNRAYLREDIGRTGPVRRIYNGLDLTEFAFRSPLERPPLVAAVGRLIEKKGFGDLVEACALLDRRGIDFRCRIIGTGDLEASLRAQIERLGLVSKVELTGPRPQSEVARHVQEAAVFAAPCVIGADGNRDGLPTVLLEAMALGTPCVSTEVTGIPEVLRHEETGLRVPQHDPHALAGAIQRLLSDPELRVRLANSARDLMESRFDIHANTADLRKVFTTEESSCRLPRLAVSAM